MLLLDALAVLGVANAAAYGFRLLQRGRRRRRWQRQPAVAAPGMQRELQRFLALQAPRAAMAVGVLDGVGERHLFAGQIDGAGSPCPDVRTRFELGSVTKTFTAALLQVMQDAGALAVGTPATQLLPTPALEHLASHTAGLPRLPVCAPMLAGLLLRPRQPYAWLDEAALRRWLQRHPLPCVERGYRYSNLGHALLGLALAEAGGSSFATLLQQHVLAPLQLAATGFHGPVATPHGRFGQRLAPWRMRAMCPAGGLRSDLADVCRWLRAHLEGKAPLDPQRLCAPRASAGTGTRRVALGWHVQRHHGETLIWHNGATGGSSAFVGFVPARGVAVAVLCSQAVPVDALALRLLDHALGRGDAAAPTT